ncbi:putative component of NuA3 histone acetyltransferase complex [Kickxella alabastrina]|uniref:Component of NuA3 histone acetyltransferase complex n=1 Tax=Kickxella alabastrina TaxID=61397 RepID=A0ACC1I6I1_9FUNG|nr:putative component of NuA3 histone acetyltransferase complex [Kickxella alabastrina]
MDDSFWAKATLQGPAHLRRYIEATPSASPAVAGLALFLRSASFARLLAALTSLDFINASQQVRKFERGDYTLIHDQALEPAGLDATISLQKPKLADDDQELAWEESWGGATHYIADKDELLRISPESNSLSLVLRDEGTLRFIKYLNHMAQSDRQEISMVFIEQPSEEDEDEDEDEYE